MGLFGFKKISEQPVFFSFLSALFPLMQTFIGSSQGLAISLFPTLGKQEMNCTSEASHAGKPVGRSSSADGASFPF